MSGHRRAVNLEKPSNKQAVAKANAAEPECKTPAQRKRWMDAYIAAGGEYKVIKKSGCKPSDPTSHCPKCDPTVTIGSVRRGTYRRATNIGTPTNKQAVTKANTTVPEAKTLAQQKTWMDAYVAAGGEYEDVIQKSGVTAVDSISASVPPTKTYKVKVTVTPTLDGCPGQYVELSIINGSVDNGTATVSPTRITKTSMVKIKGVTQTKRGHSGQLKIQAKLDGVTVKSTSAGFSVCAHPINYRDPFHHDIDTPTKVGVAVADDWDSDSGTFADLDETEISEVVDYVGKNDSPPFPARGAAAFHNSGYLPGNEKTVDSHTMGRASIAKGPAGVSEANQLCIYKCHRCGATDIAHPNSGFKRIHEVFNVGGVWKHRTRKIGAAVTIGAHSTGAGAANVVSSDHVL